MAEHLLKFVNLPKAMPDKREAGLRREDFQEIYDRFRPAAASAQASRCSQCGVPFCQVHCPLNNNIPDWLKLTAEGRLEEAYEIASATNTFPEICGRICPQDRLCEGNCVIEQSGHGDGHHRLDRDATSPTPPSRRAGSSRSSRRASAPNRSASSAPGRRASPRPSSCAARATRCTVYDRYDRVGGLMIYGIPNFKLEKPIVAAPRRAAGRGRHPLPPELRGRPRRRRSPSCERKHDARADRDRRLQGARDGRRRASASTTSCRRSTISPPATARASATPCRSSTSGALDAAGKHVVVIGGGDTAMDCVRTAVRQGAMSVNCLYRRDRANMPGSQREVAHAEEEGVEFVWLAAPEAFLGEPTTA